MIKTVIHIADLHIPNNVNDKSFDPSSLFTTMAEKLIDTAEEETRIVISGDIFQNKVKISNEAMLAFHKLLNVLNKFGKTLIIAGNHDMLENNLGKLDSITPTFEIEGVFPNVCYVDKKLGYKSGYIVDDNVVWILYSIFDKFAKPNVDDIREVYKDKRIIGLYHGNIVGSVTDVGYVSESGIDTTVFEMCDSVMAGHIHKYQVLKRNGVPIVYSGSVYQQNFGENITGHGFVMWDLETMEHTLVEVPNKNRMLKFEVTSYDDVVNDNERLLNL